MSDKKHTNPIMTKEWFEALMSTPSMRGTEAEMDERAKEEYLKRLAEDMPVNPHLQELIDGLPLPDGTVIPTDPEVLEKEKAFFESVERGDHSTAPPPSVEERIQDAIVGIERAQSLMDEVSVELAEALEALLQIGGSE